MFSKTSFIRVRKVQRLILLCLLTLLPTPALCDDALLKIYGGGLKLFDGESTSVRMESETVRIDLHKKNYTVDATFEFFNYGKTITAKVGFPKSGYGYTASFRGVADFINFETWVNGNKIDVKEILGEMKLDKKAVDDKQRSEIKRGVIGGALEERRWLVKDVTFKGNKKTITRVRYTVPYGGVGRHENSGEYIYGTGKSWKGTIGKARFIIKESPEVSLLGDVAFTDNGYYQNIRKYGFKRLGGYEYEYTLEDFEPKENENLKFDITSNWDMELTPAFSGKVVERKNLEHLPLWQMKILRNAIYAFHGKIFSDPKLDDFFKKYDWYKPRPDFKESDLNKIEKENIAVIAAYENELAALRSK